MIYNMGHEYLNKLFGLIELGDQTYLWFVKIYYSVVIQIITFNIDFFSVLKNANIHWETIAFFKFQTI